MRSPKILHRLKPSEASGSISMDNLGVLIFKNLSLKIFALGLAVLMWGFVASQQRGESTEIKFTAPLVLKNIPADLEVTTTMDQFATVSVEVRRDLARTINPNQFQMVINLRDHMAGEYQFKLDARNVSYKNQPLPSGITLLQISPGSIPLNLEETVVKRIRIRPRFSGDLASGFILESIVLDPVFVELRGPTSVLPKVKSVPTQPLDLQDLRSNVEMPVTLDLPPLIRLASPKETIFKAYVNVSNNPKQVLLLDIPVVFDNAEYAYKASITKLNAHVEGPKEVMDELDRKKVFALVDLSKFPPGDYRRLTPKVSLPKTAKVLEQWPILNLFVLNRKLESSAGQKSPRINEATKIKKEAQVTGAPAKTDKKAAQGKNQ